MLALRMAFLLAVICGITGGAGAPTYEETRSHSRTRRGPGGLITVLELMQGLRGFCETLKGITMMLEMYPLSAVGDVLFNLPVPIPNIQYFDRLNVIGTIQNALRTVQRMVNRLNILNLNFGKRDLTQEIQGLNDDLVANLPSGPIAFREDDEYFEIPTEREPVRVTEAPYTPGLLLRLRDLFNLQDVICPSVDFVESVLTKSPIAFLHFERLPIPLLDGEHTFNLITAFDLYNLTGVVSSVFG